jgi:hypothetical protein
LCELVKGLGRRKTNISYVEDDDDRNTVTCTV